MPGHVCDTRAQMVPNVDDMVRELHVRTVQFVHKHLSAAKPVSDEAAEAKGGTLEEQIRRMQSQLSLGAEDEDEDVAKVELADQEEVTGEGAWSFENCGKNSKEQKEVKLKYAACDTPSCNTCVSSTLQILFLLRSCRYQMPMVNPRTCPAL